ncbi:hypothetical protein SAMN04515695_1011 [Pseudovibrio sp. Tun.PSC04-5.I4]|nr:hypothetical protein SAMN04515695_1011 [Pseudovibrio sp. Tun.PSC04-5.I4]
MAEINIPLDIDSLEVVSQAIDNDGNITLEVVSKNEHSACHKCGKPATKPNGTAPVRTIRQRSIFDRDVYRKRPIRG